MCYHVVEQYSVCRCVYYKHPIDMCYKYGTPGHEVAPRTVLVGYACERHSNAQATFVTSSVRKPRSKRKGNQPETKVESKISHRDRVSIPSHSSQTRLNAGPIVTGTTTTRDNDLDPEITPISSKISANIHSEDDDANSDCSKIASQIWTEPETTADSISTIPKVEIASAELVSLLVEDPRLQSLYAPAITVLGHNATREALIVVLKSYAKALKTNSHQSQEYKAGELVRSYARRIAYACVAFHDPSVPTVDLDDPCAPTIDVEGRWEALHRQKIQASSRVEEYLNNLGSQTNLDYDRQEDLEELSDDGDRDDIEDPLPNLSKVKAFMINGPPFEQLFTDILNLPTRNQGQTGNEQGALETQKSETTTQNSRELYLPDQRSNIRPKASLLELYVLIGFIVEVYKLCYIFITWVKSDFWPKLTPGSTRLDWKCECGSLLYEDYSTTDTNTITKLASLIARPVNATTASFSNSGSLNIQYLGTVSLSSDTTGSNTEESKDSVSESTHVCQILNGNCTLCLKRVSRKFLALCVNTGRFHKTLGEIEVTDICRDSDAFSRIKSRYLEVRSFRARARRLFLLRANKVHFVKINIEDVFRADIIEAPSIPPITEVHSKRYEYSPLDLPLPPITSNSFLHYLENPDCESLKRTKRWLSCLPKRLEEQLLSKRISSEPDIIVSGWGIHIDETLNEEGLAILAFVILALSALVGVAYSVKMGDASGGFTIAGYIATTLGVFVTVMYFRWQQE